MRFSGGKFVRTSAIRWILGGRTLVRPDLGQGHHGRCDPGEGDGRWRRPSSRTRFGAATASIPPPGLVLIVGLRCMPLVISGPGGGDAIICSSSPLVWRWRWRWLQVLLVLLLLVRIITIVTEGRDRRQALDANTGSTSSRQSPLSLSIRMHRCFCSRRGQVGGGMGSSRITSTIRTVLRTTDRLNAIHRRESRKEREKASRKKRRVKIQNQDICVGIEGSWKGWVVGRRKWRETKKKKRGEGKESLTKPRRRLVWR